MAYCPKCGVEINSKRCPICSYVIKSDIYKSNLNVEVNEKKELHLSKKDKYKLFAVSTYFFSILIMGLNITIDILLNEKVTWSVFPTIPLLTMSFITTVAIYVKGILKAICIFLFTLLMLLLLDLYIPEANFFLKVSLPIVCISSLLSLGIVLLSKKSKRIGANLAGYIILSIAILTISIEVIVQMFNHSEVRLSWSLITSVSLTPIAVFLLYIHYILSKRINLKKIFHT